MNCEIFECENEADRVVVLNVDDEWTVTDALGSYQTRVAVGPLQVHVCGNHPSTDSPRLVSWRAVRNEWDGDVPAYGSRRITEVRDVKVALG